MSDLMFIPSSTRSYSCMEEVHLDPELVSVWDDIKDGNDNRKFM